MIVENLESLKVRNQEPITIDLSQNSTTLIQEIPLITTNKVVPPQKKDPSKFLF
jgi:hypothetical protein